MGREVLESSSPRFQRGAIPSSYRPAKPIKSPAFACEHRAFVIPRSRVRPSVTSPTDVRGAYSPVDRRNLSIQAFGDTWSQRSHDSLSNPLFVSCRAAVWPSAIRETHLVPRRFAEKVGDPNTRCHHRPFHSQDLADFAEIFGLVIYPAFPTTSMIPRSTEAVKPPTSVTGPRVALRVAGRENGSWDFGFLPDEGVWTCDLRGSRAIRVPWP